MRWIGLDPGSRKTGYAVLEMGSDRCVRYLECGLITADSKELAHRLLEIGQGLHEIIQEFSPSHAAVEDVFTAQNSRAALILGQARGVVLYVLASCGIPLVSYMPNHVKKAVTGQGRASKNQVRRNMMALLKLVHEPAEDASDALALAYCHALHANRHIPGRTR